MRLPEYVRRCGQGSMKSISKSSGVSYATIRNAASGMLISNYAVAKAISQATKGKVSIKELCETKK